MSLKRTGLLCIVFVSHFAVAQCDVRKLLDSCAGVPKEYVFAKARVIYIQNDKDKLKSTYGITLSRGLSYIITLNEPPAGGNDGKMVVNLMDKQDNLIVSNYDKKKHKYYNKVLFNCNASGTYYLSYMFDGGAGKGCGVSSVGFAKTKL